LNLPRCRLSGNGWAISSDQNGARRSFSKAVRSPNGSLSNSLFCDLKLIVSQIPVPRDMSRAKDKFAVRFQDRILRTGGDGSFYALNGDSERLGPSVHEQEHTFSNSFQLSQQMFPAQRRSNTEFVAHHGFCRPSVQDLQNMQTCNERRCIGEKTKTSCVQQSQSQKYIKTHVLQDKRNDESNVKQLPSHEQTNAKFVKRDQDRLFFSRKPRRVAFEPYSIEDYMQRKPKEYVELGKLRLDPNSGEMRERREKLERMKRYAERQKSLLLESQSSKLPNGSKNTDSERKRPMLQAHEERMVGKAKSARQRGIEFARSVPRPGQASNMIRSQKRKPFDGEPNSESSLLGQLELEHEKARTAVADMMRLL